MLRLLVTLACLVGLSWSATVERRLEDNGGHYRAGSLSWRRLHGNTVQFELHTAWRRNYTSSYFSGSGADGFAVRGDEIILNGRDWPVLAFGDGDTAMYLKLQVTAHAVAENWIQGKTVVNHTYSTPNNKGVAWAVSFTGCCRVSTLNKVVASDATWSLTSSVDLLRGTASPVIAVLPVVAVLDGSAASSHSVPVPASNPLQSALSWTLQSTGVSSGPAGQVGRAINATTGVMMVSLPGNLDFLTGAVLGMQTTVRVSSGTSFTEADFILMVMQTSGGHSPPSMRPPTATVASDLPSLSVPKDLYAGTTVSYTVHASDADSSDIVGFSVSVNSPAVRFSTVRKEGTGLWAMDVTWEACRGDVGLQYLCATARDNRGTSSLPQCALFRVLEDPDPAYMAGAPSAYTFTMGLRSTLTLDVRDDNCKDSHTVATTGNSGFTGAIVSLAPLQPLAGVCGTRVSMEWAPPAGMGGVSSEVCFSVSDACGGCGCSSKRSIAEHCVNVTVARCVFSLPQDQTLGAVAHSVGTDWVRLWQLNIGIMHPDFLVSAGQMLQIGRLVTVPPHSTVKTLAAQYGMTEAHLRSLNRNIGAGDGVQAGSDICVVPNGCAAKLMQPNSPSFRDQDWFRRAQTDRD